MDSSRVSRASHKLIMGVSPLSPTQAPRLLAAAAWTLLSISCAALADTNKAKSISDALADADRYAGGYNDAYVANAWERAVDGWVRGGYTLVAGDVHTDVRYVVDPSGEMRVMARRPGVAAQAPAADAARVSSASTAAAMHHQLGRPLLGGYRPPFYRRLVRLGSLHDDEPFDDVDLDLDDEPVDDDDPFFFDVVPDNWNAAGPVDEWVRLVQDPASGVRRGPDGPRVHVGCKSVRCRVGHPGVAGGVYPAPAASTGAPPPAETSTAAAAEDAVGAASFQSGHYNVVLKTSAE